MSLSASAASRPRVAPTAPRGRATISARAPLRLGFAGGGTDLSPYCDRFGGAVLNASIDLYAHARISPSPDSRWHLVARDLGIAEAYVHPTDAARATRLPIHAAVLHDVARTEPVPLQLETWVETSPGSGLGASSALAVALVACVGAHRGQAIDAGAVARDAYRIERLEARLPGGRQDFYAAALGGVNFLSFLPGERVLVEPVRLPAETRSALEDSLLICTPGPSADGALRDPGRIIAEQRRAIAAEDREALACLHAMKRDADDMRDALLRGDVAGVGGLLARAWAAKKRTATGISTARIEQLHAVAQSQGAIGGKVCGAGGGGTMMFVVPPARRDAVATGLAAAGAVPRPVRLTARGVRLGRDPA